MEEYKYKREICKLLNIEEDRYEKSIKNYNNILNHNIMLLKKDDINIDGLFENMFSKIYNSEENKCCYISEKCINRYERLTSKLHVDSIEFKDTIDLFCEIAEICSFENLWILEFSRDDDYCFDEIMDQLLVVGQKLGLFFLEKTQKIYEKTFPKQNVEANENKEEKFQVKTLGTKTRKQ